jgi:hypothetical protein
MRSTKWPLVGMLAARLVVADENRGPSATKMNSGRFSPYNKEPLQPATVPSS